MQSVREFLHMQKLGSTSSRKGAVRRPWERGEGFPLQCLVKEADGSSFLEYDMQTTDYIFAAHHIQNIRGAIGLL